MEVLKKPKVRFSPIYLVILIAFFVAPVFAIASTLKDWNEIIDAVNQANLDGSGNIHLASRSIIVVDQPLPVISSDVFITGNGARLEAAPSYHGALIQISETGSLGITDLQISGFDRNTFQTPPTFPALVDNHGNLHIERVTFWENPSCQPCSETLSILDNHGQAFLNNITVYKNHTRAPESDHQTSNIRNCGSMEILNSTLAKNTSSIGRGITGIQVPVPAAITAFIPNECGPGTFDIGNTLLDNDGGNCGELGEVSDLGGNFDSDGSCGFDSDKNVNNRRPRFSQFGLQGGLVPTLGLKPASRAIDIGINENCSAIDARMAIRPTPGKIGAESKCDSGAFEFAGSFGDADLSANGMSGLWFNKATDGHYVHVLRVSSDRVYLNWTAFDQYADQLWIFAVATTNGSSSFSAIAYKNSGGQLVPGGAPDGHTVEEWGEIELDFTSCLAGNFSYRAYDPDIGEGQFELNRLAFLEGVGCSNSE